MKKVLLILATLGVSLYAFTQPCSTTNGTNCICADGTQNCELLPDLMISWYGLENDTPTEYSQTGNGVDNGRLRVTGSTPNIGYGSFTVLGTDYFICGTDTIYDPTRSISTCPGGGEPTNLLKQRIYSKNGNTVTYTDRWAGGQTFHPSHGHNHVDDWVSFTLRLEDPNEPDTLQWPIIGSGAKIGFCLMDLSNCSSSYGDCRDSHIYGQGNILNHNNLPNFGMGGGTYSCNPIEQGISAGYVDIYSQVLEGMWIDIPPGTCNGDYWIVAQVDPRNDFLESNENNNWTAIPFTLTKQMPNGNATAPVQVSSLPYICNSSTSVTLSTTPGMSSYIWSTGETTNSITVTQPGDYFVETISTCGTGISDTISISAISAVVGGTVGDTVCLGSQAVVTAAGAGVIDWFNNSTGGNSLHNGASFTTSAITQSTTLYAQNTIRIGDPNQFVGQANQTGTAVDDPSISEYLYFDAFDDFTLESVKVYAEVAGLRKIELYDGNGTVVADTLINIPAGVSRVGLNFEISGGEFYYLGTDWQQNMTSFGDYGPRLRRSDNGVAYPYEIVDLVAISTSSAGPDYYYYFYDWEISTGSFTCPSPRVPVEITVEQHTGISINGVDAAYLLNDAAVPLNASIPNGNFVGRGVTTDGNGQAYFSPTLAGVNDSIAITYTYTTPVGCAADTVLYITVLPNPSTGMTELTDNRLLFYPNPAQNTLTIALPSGMDGGTLSIIDATGKTVLSQALPAGNPRQTFDVSLLAKGMYFLRLDGATGSRFGKLSKL